MTTDRELLEYAAKAAGMVLLQVPNRNQTDADWWAYSMDALPNTAKPWNPRTDDGDALRLAVNLKLAIRPLEKCVFVESDPETLLSQSAVSELEMYGKVQDPYAATRRAIVRVAAEIGKAMS